MIIGTQLVNGLATLKRSLDIHTIPPDIIKQSLIDNPWFTEYYIKYSLDHIRSWLNEKTLHAFLAKYSLKTPTSAMKIGIISAGNFPLAGFHDILITLLSGHVAIIKLSHQDKHLIPYILNQWLIIDSKLEGKFFFSDPLKDIDFLIASGSTNTSRFLASSFKGLPKLIRKSRYSVAILDENTTESQLNQLTHDILLFNGLGCRNVSNIMTLPKFDIHRLIRALSNYKFERLNALYFEKVQFEKVRFTTIKSNFMYAHYVLIRTSTYPSFAPMGIVNKIDLANYPQILQLIEKNRPDIQCIVNKGTDFGQSQRPNLDDFADNVDVMGILTQM